MTQDSLRLLGRGSRLPFGLDMVGGALSCAKTVQWNGKYPLYYGSILAKVDMRGGAKSP